MAILERGGNAFDAAVATGFVLQVVEPHNNGPGGEVPIVLWSERERRVDVVCGQGSAPAAATAKAFRDLDLELIPGSGLLPAVVPGAFAAWMRLLRDYGTLPLRDVLMPAIGYARDGYPLLPVVATVLGGVRRLFVEEWHTSAATYLPNGEVPAPGSFFRNPVLAQTYLRVLGEAEAAGGDRAVQIDAARRAFYEGFVAEAIDRFCRETEVMDTSGRRHRGLLRGEDMAAWRETVEAPVSYQYGDYTVFKTGPWGQGPVFLQQLALLKGFALEDLAPAHPDFVHTVIECTKLAFADRDAYYADPAHVEVPLDALLGDAYNDARRSQVGEHASHELRPGSIDGRTPRLVVRPLGTLKSIAYPEALDFGEPTAIQFASSLEQKTLSRGDTCHLDIIDRHGNMVAATPSGAWLHGSPVIPALGWGLTLRGEMFWLDESLPGCVAPGKRPRTTLTPTLAFRGGEPYMAFGTPGGDQQDQWALHAFLRHVHFGLDLQAAIDAPEFHTKHLVDSFFPRECNRGHLALEGRFSEAARRELERRGHRLTIHGDWSLGYVCAATRRERVLRAGASPRFMQAYAVGR
jgi:gamma-glutamyltranspeptidase/glutathione hydrolase